MDVRQARWKVPKKYAETIGGTNQLRHRSGHGLPKSSQANLDQANLDHVYSLTCPMRDAGRPRPPSSRFASYFLILSSVTLEDTRSL